MTAREFCYWLQGYYELGGSTELNANQLGTIKNHLAMVFKHEIDPSAGSPEHQTALSQLHNGQFENLEDVVKKIIQENPAPPHSHPAPLGETRLRC
jgi:hypothetical protein